MNSVHILVSFQAVNLCGLYVFGFPIILSPRACMEVGTHQHLSMSLYILDNQEENGGVCLQTLSPQPATSGYKQDLVKSLLNSLVSWRRVWLPRLLSCAFWTLIIFISKLILEFDTEPD